MTSAKKQAVSRVVREAAVLFLLFVTFEISNKRP